MSEKASNKSFIFPLLSCALTSTTSLPSFVILKVVMQGSRPLEPLVRMKTMSSSSGREGFKLLEARVDACTASLAYFSVR